ncbi:winged helix family transcriptional regulator [Paenibacillus albus]|uniref:Winged helix family transcriptional regulator n=1 Tax=Paenibacillus albus TaxID=2495582 RepID=A0A3Q8X9L8_9BACL|nr:winged helix family transcriptional regulator [Paenibacillus albus]
MPQLGAFPAHAAPSTASADHGEQSAAQVRRSSELRSGPFRLSAAERKLWKDGTEIVLTPTEWTLVKLLMEREGEGLSRDDILNSVWGRHYVGDLKIVDVNIRRIRQKIEINPSEPRHIETLWGFGYRWKRGEEQ